MRLNVIGNGFDLYHGLPSYYYHFGCYLIDNDPEFYEEIGRMYGIQIGRMIGPAIAHDYEHAVEQMFWRDFEVSLGNVEEDFVIGINPSDLGLENPDPVEIDMDEHQIADKLKRAFSNWVEDTLDCSDNYTMIKDAIVASEAEVDIHVNDFFLVFNYTHILQQIYNIPESNIHYIHGESMGTGEDDLVVGHGNRERIETLKKYVEELDDDYNYTQSSKNAIEEHRCLIRILDILEKDVNLCKFLASSFYSNINQEISTVRIFGLSLGDVDIPYLHQIRSKWPNAKWEFSYYSNADEERVKDVASNIINLDESSFDTFAFSNPSASIICDSIVSSIGLNLHPTV